MSRIRSTLVALAVLALPGTVAAQQHAMTIADYLSLKTVGDPQLSPDGKTVAYTVTDVSLEKNTGITHIWLAPLAGGTPRQITFGPGSDMAPRWSPDGRTLAFISTREDGAQVWVLPIAEGGEAHRLTKLSDGANDLLWMPDGKALLVIADTKWPKMQEIDERNGAFPTEAKIWTNLMYRHWNEWRVGKRQHVFRVDVAGGTTTDLTPVDHDVPTIATAGAGDVAISPDGHEIAVAMHGDSTVADNTDVDVYVMGPDGGAMRDLTTSAHGADNTPRFSPDGKWLSYISLERPGFEADRGRLMLLARNDDRTGGTPTEATKGWSLSVGAYAWCPNAACVYAQVEERGSDVIYRIDIPSFTRTRVETGGVNSNVQVGPDSKTLVYLHQSNTQPAEVWTDGHAFTHVNDSAVATLDLHPLESFGFVGAMGDSVFGWILKPPHFDPHKKYPLVYLVHGGPQGAWTDDWHPRWNYQMFASPGYVIAAVNFHGSTGYGQKFTDAISRHWGDYPFEDLMKGLDVVSKLPYVDSTRMGAAGASYGGYMIYWMEGHTHRFKAVVDHDGIFNTVSAFGSTEELWFPMWEFGGTPYEGTPDGNRALYEKFSPLNFVKNWQTPMLIIHSQHDYRLDLSQGLEAFTALQVMRVPSKFLYFPNEFHFVTKPRDRRLWWGVVLDWLNQYLQPGR